MSLQEMHLVGTKSFQQKGTFSTGMSRYDSIRRSIADRLSWIFHNGLKY